MMNFELDSKGQLPAFAWPGGYPIFYVDAHCSVLCPACATESLGDDDEKFRPSACDVHWEGEPLICENCNCEIESAYGPVDPPPPE